MEKKSGASKKILSESTEIYPKCTNLKMLYKNNQVLDERKKYMEGHSWYIM